MGLFSFLGSAAGAAVAPIAGQVVGGLLGMGTNAMNNSANKELMKYQYDLALEQWNRENEYNKPINQMSRLQEAGLNPNLVYGDGTVANTAASSPQPKAPRLEAYTNFGDLGVSAAINALQNAQRIDKENKVADSQIASNNAIANNQNAQALNHLDTHDVNGNEIVKQSMRDKILRDNEKSFIDLSKSVQDLEYSRKQLDAADEIISLNISNLKKQGKNLDANTVSALQSVNESKVRVAKLNKEIFKLQKEIDSMQDPQQKRMLSEQVTMFKMERNLALQNMWMSLYQRGQIEASQFMQLVQGKANNLPSLEQ